MALGPVLMFDPEQKPVSKNLDDAKSAGLSGRGYSAHSVLFLSPQNRSVQPEFQDRQAHAGCVQRVGHQTPLALESSHSASSAEGGLRVLVPSPLPPLCLLQSCSGARTGSWVPPEGPRHLGPLTLQLAFPPPRLELQHPQPQGSEDFGEQGGAER